MLTDGRTQTDVRTTDGRTHGQPAGKHNTPPLTCGGKAGWKMPWNFWRWGFLLSALGLPTFGVGASYFWHWCVLLIHSIISLRWTQCTFRDIPVIILSLNFLLVEKADRVYGGGGGLVVEQGPNVLADGAGDVVKIWWCITGVFVFFRLPYLSIRSTLSERRFDIDWNTVSEDR